MSDSVHILQMVVKHHDGTQSVTSIACFSHDVDAKRAAQERDQQIGLVVQGGRVKISTPTGAVTGPTVKELLAQLGIQAIAHRVVPVEVQSGMVLKPKPVILTS